MALYQNTIKQRVILSNQHSVNPAGSKNHHGHPTDTVELDDEALKLPGVKAMLAKQSDGSDPVLRPYKAPTAAEAKAAQEAAAKSAGTTPDPKADKAASDKAAADKAASDKAAADAKNDAKK